MTYFFCYIDADTVVGDVPDHLKEVVACDNSLFEEWINAKKAERVMHFVEYLVWKNCPKPSKWLFAYLHVVERFGYFFDAL